MDKEKKFWKEYQEANSLERQKMIEEWFEPKPFGGSLLGGLAGGFITILVGASILNHIMPYIMPKDATIPPNQTITHPP